MNQTKQNKVLGPKTQENKIAVYLCRTCELISLWREITTDTAAVVCTENAKKCQDEATTEGGKGGGKSRVHTSRAE